MNDLGCPEFPPETRRARRSISRPLISVVLAMAMLAHVSTAAASGDMDAGIDTPAEVVDAIDNALDQVPAIEETVNASRADTADLDIDVSESAEIAVLLETADGSRLELPDDPVDPVVIETASGIEVELDLPGEAEDAQVMMDGSVVYEEAAPDTDLVVQAQSDGGVRVLTVIDGERAPSQFNFDFDHGGYLDLQPDGSVLARGDDGLPVGFVPAPWAYDANGEDVPTWYVIDDGALVLHVDHSAVRAYPVVADPWWNPFSWNWSKILDKIGSGATILYTHARKCLGGAASWAVPAAGGVVSGNVLSKVISGRHAIRVGGGPWFYAGTAVAGCIASYL